VNASRARLVGASGTTIEVNRDRGQAVITAMSCPTADEIVHPCLASVAAVMAYWCEWESFHAGAVVLEGRLWALVGARGSGKTTTLAALAMDGHQIIADDMLVVRGATALAGPRILDLRAETAHALGIGSDLGIVGSRPRWRLRTGHVTSEQPLCGWVFLDWGRRLEIELLGAAERLTRLLPNRGIRFQARDPAGLLDLAGLPGFVLYRPRGLDGLEATVSLLAAATEAL